MCIKTISLKLIYKIDLSNCFIKSNSTKFKFISFKFIPPDQIQPNSNIKFISLKLIYKFPAHRTSTQDQHTGPTHGQHTGSTRSAHNPIVVHLWSSHVWRFWHFRHLKQVGVIQSHSKHKLTINIKL